MSHAGAANLARYRDEMASLPETPTEKDLYDLTLKQVWGALKASKTPQQVKQKYHLAILRLVKAPTSSEKTRALAQLVALSKGKDGGESHAVAENAQDPDEE